MKIFYHNDMDGWSSAAIVAYRYWCLQQDRNLEASMLTETERLLLREYETRSMFVECDYGTNTIDPSSVAIGEDVYIVDLSFNQHTCEKLIEICNRASHVVWLDHHISSKRVIDEGFIKVNEISNLDYTIDVNMSGAALCWHKIMRDENLAKFVKYISDYDCWKKELGVVTDFFKLGIDMNEVYPWSSIWQELITDGVIERQLSSINIPENSEISNTLIRIINEGKTAKKYIDQQNSRYFNMYHFESDVFGEKCICINWKTNSWVFGNSYDFYPLCCVFAFNGSIWTYSIYSHDPNIDCSIIAQKFGGGGHRGAAGFSTKYCLFSNEADDS